MDIESLNVLVIVMWFEVNAFYYLLISSSKTILSCHWYPWFKSDCLCSHNGKVTEGHLQYSPWRSSQIKTSYLLCNDTSLHFLSIEIALHQILFDYLINNIISLIRSLSETINIIGISFWFPRQIYYVWYIAIKIALEIQSFAFNLGVS